MKNIIAQEQPKSNTEVPPILCICCDAPATAALSDWDVCDVCYNILAAPEVPFDGYVSWLDDDEVDDYGISEATL